MFRPVFLILNHLRLQLSFSTRTDDYWNTHPKTGISTLKLLELLFTFISAV
jgi:hypothetical protein